MKYVARTSSENKHRRTKSVDNKRPPERSAYSLMDDGKTLYTASTSLVSSILGTVVAWVFNLLCGLFCIMAVAIWIHKDDAHIIKVVPTATNSKDRPNVPSPAKQVLPERSPPKGSVGPGQLQPTVKNVPSPANNVLPVELLPPVECAGLGRLQLKVTNCINATLQLTCQQAPKFEGWIAEGETAALPNSVKSPAIICVQGYRKDRSSVKLVQSIDLQNVSCVRIDEVNGVIHIIECATQS